MCNQLSKLSYTNMRRVLSRYGSVDKIHFDFLDLSFFTMDIKIPVLVCLQSTMVGIWNLHPHAIALRGISMSQSGKQSSVTFPSIQHFTVPCWFSKKYDGKSIWWHSKRGLLSNNWIMIFIRFKLPTSTMWIVVLKPAAALVAFFASKICTACTLKWRIKSRHYK